MQSALEAIPLPAAGVHNPRHLPKVGVLLCNLGTPDGTGYWALRRYLAEFLSDPRVIGLPRLLWLPLLHGVVLVTRPARRGRDYARIWNRERDESPLKTHTRGQAQKLAALIDRGLLGSRPGQVAVEWGMRYGNPSLGAALGRLSAQGCERVLLVPLYPQYSAATTATACDKVFEILAAMRHQPALRVVPAYHDDPLYIEAVCGSVSDHLAGLSHEPEMILASFHGMPEAAAGAGDPYVLQCLRTGELIRQRLGLPLDRFKVTFQSRFGPARWVKPYTDETVEALAATGVKRLAVLTPGFSADCLETIDEIGRENAEIFHAAGGRELIRIPCLNDSDAGMRLIEGLVRRELQGWI